MEREDFYSKQILKYIKEKNSKILVMGAGKLDKKLFSHLGYKNVTFSNISNSRENSISVYENLHNINLGDNEYEFCVAHACVHHSSKPHLSILELFRVCSKGSLIIEANDSYLSRLACKFGLSEEYELSAVNKNIQDGGVDNTNIPNYVYRWNEREIHKLMKSFRPDVKHKIFFDYGHQIKFTKLKVVKLFFDIFFMIFKKQKNLLSIYIDKDERNMELNNWIKK